MELISALLANPYVWFASQILKIWGVMFFIGLGYWLVLREHPLYRIGRILMFCTVQIPVWFWARTIAGKIVVLLFILFMGIAMHLGRMHAYQGFTFWPSF